MHLDRDFWPALLKLGAETGTPPEWFLRFFYLESRLDPSAANKYGYVGLNQLGSSYLRRHGIDPADYKTWLASQQMKVIAPFMKAQLRLLSAPPTSPGVLYALNLWPAGVKRGTSADTVLIRSNSTDPYEVKAYNANRPLDYDGSGAITIGDLDAVLNRLAGARDYQAARMLLAVEKPPSAALPVLLFGVVGAILGMGGTFVLRERARERARRLPVRGRSM